jgi:hypothetical protein
MVFSMLAARVDARVDVNAKALHASVSHSPSGPEVRSLRAHFSPHWLFSALDTSQQASGVAMQVSTTHYAVSLDIGSIFPMEIAHGSYNCGAHQFYLQGDRGDEGGWMLALSNRWNICALTPMVGSNYVVFIFISKITSQLFGPSAASSRAGSAGSQEGLPLLEGMA